MRARFTESSGAPAFDYRHAHVVDAGGRLATITDVYRDDVRGGYLAALRRFNGEDAGTQFLDTLDILEREVTRPPGIEVFHVPFHGTPVTGAVDPEAESYPYEPGFYWWSCQPGCLPDCDPVGPFETEAEALENAMVDYNSEP